MAQVLEAGLHRAETDRRALLLARVVEWVREMEDM